VNSVKVLDIKRQIHIPCLVAIIDDIRLPIGIRKASLTNLSAVRAMETYRDEELILSLNMESAVILSINSGEKDGLVSIVFSLANKASRR
jgi:hypothetical protein